MSGTYKTRDGRFIILSMLGADRYWADFCTVIGLPEVINDPRFIDVPAQPTRAPEQGEHTEAVLLDKGLSWEEISKLKDGQ